MGNVLGFLGRNELGLPLWGWALAIGGAVVLVIVAPKLFGTKDQAASSDSKAPALPSEIDPLTGVPYNIESQINPATGLPAYYGVGSTGNGAPGQGGTGGGPAPTVEDAWRAASSAGGSPPAWFVQWWNSGHQGTPPMPISPPVLPPGAGQPGVGLTPILPPTRVNPPNLWPGPGVFR